MLLILILFVFMLGLMAGGALAARAATANSRGESHEHGHIEHSPKPLPHGPHIAEKPLVEKLNGPSVPLPGMSAERELSLDLPEENEPHLEHKHKEPKPLKAKDRNETNKHTIMAVLEGKTETIPSEDIEELMQIPDDMVNKYMAELEAEGKIFKNERRDFSAHLHT